MIIKIHERMRQNIPILQNSCPYQSSRSNLILFLFRMFSINETFLNSAVFSNDPIVFFIAEPFAPLFYSR